MGCAESAIDFFAKKNLFVGEKHRIAHHMINEVHGVFHFEFLEQTCPVVINGPGAEVQCCADFFTGTALHHQLEHLFFPFAEHNKRNLALIAKGCHHLIGHA